MSHMEMILLRMTKSMFWRLFILHPTGVELSWLSFQILGVLFLLGILKPWSAFWCDSCSQLHHCTRNKETWGFSYPYQHPAPPALTTPALANTKHWSKLFLQRLIVLENWKQPLRGFGFFSSIVLKPISLQTCHRHLLWCFQLSLSCTWLDHLTEATRGKQERRKEGWFCRRG